MGKKLNPNEQKIYRRVDEVLYYLWDPIGVSYDPEARDEYHRYIPTIFSLLMKTEDGTEIVDELLSIQENWMGLPGSRGRAENIVKILIRHKEWILKTSTWRQ